MADQKTEKIAYKRAQFSTRLPVDHVYSPSHFWLGRSDEEGIWRVGFTKFAARMLGEIVECEFDVQKGGVIEPGQVIGWIEGFKAASDLYSVMNGKFCDVNPIVANDACVIRKDPYRDGWLYSVKGEPDAQCMDVQGYVRFLDQTIDRMQGKANSNERVKISFLDKFFGDGFHEGKGYVWA